MPERDLKTGQFRKNENMNCPIPSRELYSTVRFAMREILMEMERTKKPVETKSSMAELDHQMNIMLKASAALLLILAALYLAVNL